MKALRRRRDAINNLFNLFFLGGRQDLEYFIRESGEILGVNGKLKGPSKDAADVLEFIFRQVHVSRRFSDPHRL